MNNNSNTFTSNNETLFLVNILNTMYNDNLRQITNLTEMLNNLNNSNNQIRTLLVQLLNRNPRRNNNLRRPNANLNNIDFNNLTNGISLSYLFDEYTIPLHSDSLNLNNVDRQNNRTNRRNRYTTMEGYARNLFDNFLQPVEIYPTQSQIESATRRVRYCDITRPINTSCPISMDEFNDTDMVTVIRHCGHTFHSDHIMNWFRSNCRCPVCRYDIREYNSNASNEFFNNSQRINDSSNNYLERNNNGNNGNSNNIYNNLLSDDYINNMAATSLENLFSNSSIFDSSGNNTTDTFTTFLINTLNRTRNAR